MKKSMLEKIFSCDIERLKLLQNAYLCHGEESFIKHFDSIYARRTGRTTKSIVKLIDSYLNTEDADCIFVLHKQAYAMDILRRIMILLEVMGLDPYKVHPYTIKTNSKKGSLIIVSKEYFEKMRHSTNQIIIVDHWVYEK